ncbi:hypothetical protein Pint_28842 [Pistacia integerrima]|uniref:Uncharacterized protein n=1 Tax=Pistacia integerrima TaxID=434235 RepID=A0ACC0X0U5_9ROSI|nr:hypothetical protein Pint_28842 [Pistacia integerrima]
MGTIYVGLKAFMEALLKIYGPRLSIFCKAQPNQKFLIHPLNSNNTLKKTKGVLIICNLN